MTNLDHALGYAVKGKPVFPCRADKTPMTSHGFKDASIDPEKIKTWWIANPDALIGMPTGATSGVVVIDVDNKNGHDGDDALFKLQQKRGKLPAAPEVLTPTGGRHIYFRHPGTPIKSTASTIGDGLDIRGDGGYVIVPPSKVGTTGYEWEASNPEAVPPMPDWLIELTKKSSSRAAARKATGGASVGSRNNHLTSRGGGMRHAGLEADAILAALLVENKKFNPPLGADEVEKIAISVAGYPAGGKPCAP